MISYNRYVDENLRQTGTGCVQYNMKCHVFTFFGRCLFVPTLTPNSTILHARSGDDAISSAVYAPIVFVYKYSIALYHIMFSFSSDIITLEFFIVKCHISL